MKYLFATTFILCFAGAIAQPISKQLPYTYDFGFGVSYHFVLTQNPKMNFSTNGYMISFGQRYGRSGILRFNGEYLNTSDLLDKFYSVGFHVGYATAKRRRFAVSKSYSSERQLLIDALISLIPRNMEYSVGISVGYMSPSLQFDLNPGEHYRIVERYLYALEMGLRMNLIIWRFKLSGGAALAYNLSDNFEFMESNTTERPRFFLKPNMNFSFSF